LNTAKFILVICLISLLGAGVYFVFKSYLFPKRFEATELVPADAVFVYETTEPISAWNQIVSQPLWERLSDIPSLKKLETQLVSMDSLLGGGGKLDRSLRGNQLVLSLHSIGKDNLDFLFGISFKEKNGDRRFMESLDPDFREKITQNKRSYGGVTIYEYDKYQDGKTLSFAMVENVLVGSYTSFLVEDAIRRAKSSDQKNFKDEFDELFTAQGKTDGLGVVRVTSQGLARFMHTISRDPNLEVVETFQKNKMSANLKLAFVDNKILLDGISLFKDGNRISFPKVSGTKGHVFGGIIPNRTALLTQYQVKDPRQIQQISNKAFENRSTLTGDIEKTFSKEKFFDLLTGEVAFLLMEETGSGEGDKILLLKTSQIQTQMQNLKDFTAGAVAASIYDYHRNREIFAIREEEFPAHLFDGQFVGFPNTFVTSHEDVLVWGNNIQAVRRFLDDVENDNTWGKTLSQKRILDALDKESGYNYIVNVSRLWNSVLNHASPNWASVLQKYAPQIKSIEMLALQLAENGNYQDIHMQLGYVLTPVKTIRDIILEENISVTFNSELTFGPKIMQNFTDGRPEFLVQDEWSRAHLITHEGDLVFTHRLDGPIVSDVFQIDYYKNGKLQMLFATERFIYGIDRLGNPLPEFPMELPNREPIEHLNLVDYENTKDYRFFVASASGNLYLLNKYGELLEGWSPKSTSSSLAAKPGHHIIPGMGDYMVALGRNGLVDFYNRRGESQTGQSLRLGESISTDYVLRQRGRSSESQLVTVTEEGEVLGVNFRGEITDRRQLLRPDRSSSFHLVKDQSNDNYIFVVHDFNKVSVLNPDTNLLFQVNLSSPSLKFQLFSFGGEKNIFVVVDELQEFVYLYNLKGELLNTRPLSGKTALDIRYSFSRNEYSIFNIHEKSFSEYRMPH
jgi:hypothetical protein